MAKWLGVAAVIGLVGSSHVAVAAEAADGETQMVGTEGGAAAPSETPAAATSPEDKVLYLRLNAGPGYGAVNSQGGLSGDGFAGMFDVSVGAYVAKGFALHGSFWIGGGAQANTIEAENVETVEGTSVAFGALGIGATQVFSPWRIYASVELGLAAAYANQWAVVDTDSSTSVASLGSQWADAGFGFRGSVGKEWQVSDSWALGFNVTYSFMTYGDKSDPTSLTISQVHWIGPTFSATFE